MGTNTQTDKRTCTRFDGVKQRLSRTRKFKGKPDVCYEIDYRDPLTGERIRKAVGWRSQGITAEYANVVRMNSVSEAQKKKFAGLAPVENQKTLTLAAAWEQYKTKWLVPRQAKSLVADSGLVANHLQDVINKPLSHITAHDLDALMASLQRKGLSTQTTKHALALIRRIMAKMIVWDMWSGPSPFAKINLPKTNNQRQRYLTPYEAKALLDALKPINTRMWLMSLVSLHCGLRFGEVASLQQADIDFEGMTLFIRDPKSGKDRFAIMTEAVKEALFDLPYTSPSALLFPNKSGERITDKDRAFDKVVKALEFNTGITDRRQKVVFHTLRHTYASWLAKSGTGQAAIAEMLGHATLEMSKRYTHLMPDARRDAAKAIHKLFMDAEG